MNETSAFRRVAATLTIGSFSLAALMGIVALLGGGDFGENEARVLLTTLIVGCASVCVLCYLATAGTRWWAVGFVGGVAVVLPVITGLLMVWGDWDEVGADLWKPFGVGVVVAATAAQICLLLALAGERRSLAVVLWPTVGLAALLALLITTMILGVDGADDSWRLLGVVAILDVLGTLVTIALAKFVRSEANDPSRRLEVGDHRLSITLSDVQAVALDGLSRRTGRPTAQLLEDALDRYLRV